MKRLLLLTLVMFLPVSAFAQQSVAIPNNQEDRTAADKDRGAVVLVKRCDTVSQSASADGKYGVLCTDSSGNLRVAISNTLASDVTEDAPETNGETGPKVMSTRRDTAASSAGTSGDNATFNTDSLGRLWTRPGRPCDDEARITSVAINISTATTTELVALASGQIVYVCGYHFVTTLANNVTWKYGTGSACGTGTTSLTGAEPYAANGGVAIANTGAVQMKNIASNALCLTTSAATQISGQLLYVSTATP